LAARPGKSHRFYQLAVPLDRCRGGAAWRRHKSFSGLRQPKLRPRLEMPWAIWGVGSTNISRSDGRRHQCHQPLTCPLAPQQNPFLRKWMQPLACRGCEGSLGNGTAVLHHGPVPSMPRITPGSMARSPGGPISHSFGSVRRGGGKALTNRTGQCRAARYFLPPSFCEQRRQRLSYRAVQLAPPSRPTNALLGTSTNRRSAGCLHRGCQQCHDFALH